MRWGEGNQKGCVYPNVKKQFVQYNPKLKGRARQLRRDSTLSLEKLGVRFLRFDDLDVKFPDGQSARHNSGMDYYTPLSACGGHPLSPKRVLTHRGESCRTSGKRTECNQLYQSPRRPSTRLSFDEGRLEQFLHFAFFLLPFYYCPDFATPTVHFSVQTE